MFFVHSRSTSCFFGYQIKHSFSCLIYRYRASGYQIKHSLSCLMSLLSVWLSGETLILICGIPFLDVWISNESLLHVFEYTTTQWWDTRQNTLSRVWYSISQSLDIGWNTLFSVFGNKKRIQDNILDLPGERKKMSYMKVSSILLFLTVWVCLVASLVCLLHSCFSWPPLESNTANKVTKKKSWQYNPF